MATDRCKVLLTSVAGAVCCCLMLAQQLPAQESQARHSRVGNPQYWTPECFLQCYKSYLQCIGSILPPRALNSEQMLLLFRNKSNGYHELIEDCSAKYKAVTSIEDDTARNMELIRLSGEMNLTSNFDLCVFTECGSGGYYGSFNVNHMKYKDILKLVNKPLDPEFDFYFQINSV